MTTAEAHTLTGAYALDAVTDLERAAFARHPAECPTCTREIAEFRETSAKLGLAMTTEPGNRLRSRVLTAVATTRQEPPSVRIGTRSPRSPRKRAVGIMAAAVLAGGISIGSLQSEPAPVAVAGAPDASVLRADGVDGGSAIVTLTRQRGEAVVATEALPPLGTGRCLPGVDHRAAWRPVRRAAARRLRCPHHAAAGRRRPHRHLHRTRGGFSAADDIDCRPGSAHLTRPRSVGEG